jgi:hypothetical protein
MPERWNSGMLWLVKAISLKDPFPMRLSIAILKQNQQKQVTIGTMWMGRL